MLVDDEEGDDAANTVLDVGGLIIIPGVGFNVGLFVRVTALVVTIACFLVIYLVGKLVDFGQSMIPVLCKEGMQAANGS